MGAQACTSEEHRDALGLVEELRALHEVSRDLLGHLDLEATLLSVVNSAVRLVDADIAGILLADGDLLRMEACVGHRTVATAHLEVRQGQGVAGRVLATRRPVAVDDYLRDGSISQDFSAIADEEGTRSTLGAPMLARGEVIGALMVWRRRPSVFGPGHEQTLTNLATMATIAIVNARLYEREHAAVVRLEDVNVRLATQNELLRRAAAVHEELTGLVLAGQGIAALVPIVAAHTAGEVAVLDPDLATLAATDASQATRFRAVRHLRSRRQGAGSTIEVAPDRDWGRWLLLRPVAAGEDLLGHLVVSLAGRPTSVDRAIVEQAAIVCALEMTRERAVLAARSRFSADFVWDLLEGGAGDDAEVLVRARSLGCRLPPRVRVLLVSVAGSGGRPAPTDPGPAQPDDSPTRARSSARWAGAADSVPVRLAERAARDAAGGEPATVLAARRGDLLALVVPGPQEASAARALAAAVVDALRRALPGCAVSAGVSACAEMSADLRQAHSQAASALSAVSVVTEGAQGVAVFDELGVLRFLLAPGDRGELWEFARGVLGPVLDYDLAHRTELVATVEAYLASDCNLQRAAEALFVHPKTVRYRLDRVEELAHRDLSCQSDRFDAQLAATILRALPLVPA